MTPKLRPRSVFWVAPIHVLITACHLFAGVLFLSCFFIGPLPIRRLALGSAILEKAFALGLLALGFIIGVFVSLAHIRRRAMIVRPLACSGTAIAAFGLLGAALAGADVLSFNVCTDPQPLAEAGFIVAVCVLACVITYRGFMKMSHPKIRGFEVVLPSQSPPLKRPTPRR